MAARRSSRTPRAAASRGVAVGDVLRAVDAFAPLAGAEAWDNVGLLAGREDWPAAKVLATIDLTDAVAREALDGDYDLVLAYHPPIFKGVRSISPSAEAPTALLADLLANRVSIIAMHTSLDAAPGGTNDVLLDAFETTRRWPLSPRIDDTRSYKLAVFVPAAEAAALRAALSDAGAGRIGNYDLCSYELAGRGTFRGSDATNPTIGRRGQFESIEETRLEMIVPRRCVAEVVRILYARHSYEEPAFDLYPLHEVADRGATGMGRVAQLTKPATGIALLKQLGRITDLRGARTVGNLRRRFASVAAAAGSFGVREFCDPDCLYLTGEFKHHDALDLLRRGITAVAMSHYASERPALERAVIELRRRVAGCTVRIAKHDADPFAPLPT